MTSAKCYHGEAIWGVRCVGVPVIGVFSGAGGLELGAAWAGGTVRVAVELDPIACQTLAANNFFGSAEVIQEDVGSVRGAELRRAARLSKREPCILVGGPPCQPFSAAAYWKDPGGEARYRRERGEGRQVRRPGRPPVRPDKRRSLVGEFFRLVAEVRPDAFVFENVPSITHPRNKAVLCRLLDDVGVAGFQFRVLTLNAAEYGVPQRRRRLFVVGFRGDAPDRPEPTHNLRRRACAMRKPVVTAEAAIRRYGGARYAEREEVVRGRWARHLAEVPPGGNYKAHTAWAGHPHPSFEAERRFWNFLLKLAPDQPSWTIPANPGPWTGPFHWQSRRLRIPELAALQSFPHAYVFYGSRRQQMSQIGNAVPPLLAQRVLEPIVARLRCS